MRNKLILVLLSISLLMSFGIIAVLITALNISEKRLNIIGDTMEEMAVQHIITEVTINEDIPLNSDITVTDELKVNINMILKTTIPFTAEIPVNEEMLIPFKIGVHDYIKLDTTIEVTDYVNIYVDDTIPLNQKMNVAVFGKKGFNMPIRGKIPVKQNLRIGFNELLPVHSVVPIDMLIVDTLPIGLSFYHLTSSAQYAALSLPRFMFLPCRALKLARFFFILSDSPSLGLPAVLAPCSPKRIIFIVVPSLASTT